MSNEERRERQRLSNRLSAKRSYYKRQSRELGTKQAIAQLRVELNNRREIRDSLRELLPDSFIGGLAWWGRDAAYGEKTDLAVWSHGGFMQGVRTHVHLWPRERAAVVGPGFAAADTTGSASSAGMAAKVSALAPTLK